MKYFAVFDNDGNRITTYVEGIHMNIPSNAIEISEEDQNLYATNDYIHGADGKPQKKPVYVLTEAEKLAQYKVQRDILLSATDNIYALNDYTINGKLLTEDQRTELRTYRQLLRDAPVNDYPEFPVKPSWLI